MDAERLFLNTLADLERRAEASDEYEVLMSAALLRKLLMNGLPLMDQVNQKHRLRLRFPINGVTPYEELVLEDRPVYWSLEDALDPELDHPPGLQAPQDATRDQLLGRRVMVVKGQTVTVRDLIDQLAHIEGAVHSGSPREQREATLKEASREVFVGGLPAGLRQVRAVGRVVLRGLAPLREAVEAQSKE